MGGVVADRKMIKELNIVLEEFNANGVILVTDGFADQELVPIIQSRIPITSISESGAITCARSVILVLGIFGTNTSPPNILSILEITKRTP